jgi:membrane protein DedA with SNARE-associated domain
MSAGVAAFVLLVVAETVFPPLAGPVLPLAGLSVAEGEAGLAATVLIATAASTLGALILYHAARAVGADRVRQFLLRHGRWSKLRPEHFDRAEAWFNRHADAAVLLGRCVPVLRSLVSIPAGLERMPWLRFVLLTGLGNLMWCSLVIGGAAALGQRVAVVQRYAAPVQAAVVAGWVVLLVVLLARHRWRRRPSSRPDVHEPAHRMEPPDPRSTDVPT